MECIQGKATFRLDRAGLEARAAAYRGVWVDVGTGDGRFVRQMAAAQPAWLLIGVDACREPLRERSRVARANELFVAANALAMPAELGGLARRLSLNFPWGSLLEGLVEGDRRLIDGLRGLAQPEALLELRLNGGAMAELGLSLEAGGARVAAVLGAAGWQTGEPAMLGAAWLRAFPSSWARRLAHGRDPRAIALRAVGL